ncbi:E3 ubiquitin-protein ligase MARCHF2-like [Leptopilina boulardi]|uniref:E3 ubiquitin-protein ligase MARCHF2-like n=1 Tax=Leptopilina boulardi TaxID=63433 RepID=UPI0021F65CEE|nr:E3 ubiquitin-protein ligase MARCHF2-like [Leptopilina boulardi]
MSDLIGNILEQIIDKVAMELMEIQCNENVIRDLQEEKISSSTIEMRSSRSRNSGLNDNFSCRICYDSQRNMQIVFPCKCKGSIGAIHLTCLEKWLEESNRSSCELCGHEFQVERTLRYRVIESIVIWLCLKQQRQRNYVHNLHSDLLRCIIVTPLTIACSYICIIAADFYSQNNYDHFPPARWTTYSLLAMISLILFSYFVWTYTAIQHHQKIWYYWWQRTSKVKVTLPEIDENRQISLSDKYVSETIF